MNVGIDAADELHMARYILIRTAEQKDLYIDFHPKPFKTKLNGSGCHTNYSTKQMREDGGMEVINNALSKLKDKHAEHISVYGKDNNTFSTGVADRGASIRIPRLTVQNKKGYFEDRRPSSNMDPYLVTSKIAETTLL